MTSKTAFIKKNIHRNDKKYHNHWSSRKKY